MDRTAPVDHPIHDLLARRWSPRAFADRGVEPDALRRLFEAARWAPSAFNEQPWRFLVARREQPEAFEALASCLVEGNQAWARRAPVLAITLAARRFARNDRENPHAWHDVGLAVAQLTVQATALGLAVHQMAGIVPERVVEVGAVPDGFEPVTGLAIGYPGDPETLPGKFRAAETAPRVRRPQNETVFGIRFGSQPGW
ncbi:MAG: nitroreductase [Acidobacteria bacterium]|nr:MAG: nitroreductase [Acidobacteriota bacterium]